MTKLRKKVELLAPAGDFEKLEIAIHYGADAVYLAGKDFSLRNFSGNFTMDELKNAVQLSHKNNVNVYVACNIYPRNFEISAISDYLLALGSINPDGIIVADPGIFTLVRKKIPHIAVHLSTQTNTTNIETALFWQNLGVKRINVARELSLSEIREITEKTEVEIEAFVHGAMCIAYSGRCLLSSYLAKRDGNRGMCAHPCRWKYAVVEENRPGQYMPFREDDRGSYVFSSKDLCLIAHLPDMIHAGIHSLKIEGRMKGIHYLATVVSVYRKAIDAYYENPEAFALQSEWEKELSGINHRGYSTGFYFGDPGEIEANQAFSFSFDDHLFIGKIIEDTPRGHLFNVRNKIRLHDPIEILSRTGPIQHDEISGIHDEEGEPLTLAQPGSIVYLKLKGKYGKNDIIRKSNMGETGH